MANATIEKPAPVRKPMSPVMILPTNSPRVRCSPCPTTKHLPEEQQHKNRRIYNTLGKTRYCVCDECGETWKMIADPADDWSQYLADLSASLEAAPVENGSIVMDVADRDEIVARLRGIASGK